MQIQWQGQIRLTDSTQHEQGDATVLGFAARFRSASEVQRGVEHRQAQRKEHHAADQKQRRRDGRARRRKIRAAAPQRLPWQVPR